MLSLQTLAALCSLALGAQATATPSALALAASYNLPDTFAYPFPAASALPMYANNTPGTHSSWTRGNNATVKYMQEHWNLNNNAVQFGREDLGFVRDPGTTAAAGNGNDSLVLAVEYPAGSYSHATGGAQFISAFPNLTTDAQAMLLTYSVYFPSDYNFVRGGKLSGLRGGDVGGCAGGEKTNGTTCFSARLMWRDGGLGEVYAYLPEKVNDLCKQNNVICDPAYGISLGRGQFTFQRGQWNDMALYVQLNNPASASNGIIQLYHNGNKSIEFTNLSLRTSPSISSVSGQMFSTFFGGSDKSWSTPTTQFTFYRDMALFASGSKVAGSSSASGTASASPAATGTGTGNNGGNGSSGGSTTGVGSASNAGATSDSPRSSKEGWIATIRSLALTGTMAFFALV